MPIKNKDGTAYKLRGPNPYLSRQERWHPGEYQLHNMDWEPFVQDGGRVPPAPIRAEPALPPEVVRAVEPALPPEVVRAVEPALPKVPLKANMFVVECLPARVKRVVDELYGTEAATIQYGYRYTFHAGTVAATDLELMLWTDRPDVAPESILFPRNGGRRWWRVAAVSPMGSGFALRCQPSAEQPSFEDPAGG